MGFLPIIIMVSGFVTLFLLVVNKSIASKKKALLQYQASFYEGLDNLGLSNQGQPGLSSSSIQSLESLFKTAKSNLTSQKNEVFEIGVKKNYNSIKITIAEYNKLIKQKPYSFVAFLMGHRPLG